MTSVPTSTLARWLGTHVEWIRHHEAGAELVDELRSAIREARRVLDRPPDRWYAGRCGDALADNAGPCGEDLYAKAGSRLVTCRGCGAEYDVEARREWLLSAVEDVLATAAEIARALTSLATPVTSSTIRGYVHRRRLESRGRDPRTGNPTYRIGDVLDLLVDDRTNSRRS